MAIKNRVERLEQATRFRDWVRFQRYLDVASDEQLEFLAVLGFWPDPPPPEPAMGKCRSDSLPRKELVKLFEVDERKRATFAHRSDGEKEFFCNHMHWPEQTCETSDCQKLWSDELRRKHQSRLTGTEATNVS